MSARPNKKKQGRALQPAAAIDFLERVERVAGVIGFAIGIKEGLAMERRGEDPRAGIRDMRDPATVPSKGAVIEGISNRISWAFDKFVTAFEGENVALEAAKEK